MARKHKHEEHENHERWLVSYADFITLLFAFFTSMYAISTLDLKKAGRMVTSMQAAFNNPVMPGGLGALSAPEAAGHTADGALLVPLLTPDGASGESAEAAKPSVKPPDEAGDAAVVAALENLREQLERALGSAGLDGQVSLTRVGRELLMTLSDAVFFESGSADLRAESLPMLASLAKVMAPLPLHVRIEGHTDSRPINTARFRSNWDLSTARATEILNYMAAEGRFDPTRLSAVGYGPYRPTSSNETAEGRARNRRVEFVIVGDLGLEALPRGSAAASEAPRVVGAGTVGE